FDLLASGTCLIAHIPAGIKKSAHAATLWPQPRQQGSRRQTEHRVPPGWRHIEQRNQHESPAVHLGMRQDHTPAAAPADRPAVARPAEINDIEIERTRPPANAQPPAGIPFELL